MAAARDQAARIVRTGPETAEDEAAREAADQLRTQVAEEPRRRPAETPDAETEGRLRLPPPPLAAAKPGKRKFVMIGVLGLLALAAIGYGVYFVLDRTLLCLDRQRLCPRQQHHARRPGVGPCRGDPARATIRSFAPAR